MKHMKQLSVFLIISLLFLVTACGSASSDAAEPTALPTDPSLASGGASEPTGNPENGLVLFKQYCSECHDIAEGQNIEGPSLFEAGTRLDYNNVKESILYPYEHLAYIQGEYEIEESTMPAGFRDLLSTQEIEDLIAYVLSLE